MGRAQVSFGYARQYVLINEIVRIKRLHSNPSIIRLNATLITGALRQPLLAQVQDHTADSDTCVLRTTTTRPCHLRDVLILVVLQFGLALPCCGRLTHIL